MTLTRTAPAKINLTLEVLGRRSDGFHDIRSVMQAVSLHDTLTFHPARPGVLTLEGGSADAPPDDDNLVLKAARAMMAETDGRHGAAIGLTKRIPVGAGLGGGSSDAAATLLGLNDLWKARVPRHRLSAIAATLGSDVPFFLTEGTALAEGRGEVLTPVPPTPPIWLALAKPAASLPTPEVYREYARVATFDRAPGDASHRMIEAIRQRAGGYHGLAHVSGALCNDLQAAAARLCPEVDALCARLSECGAAGVLLSGSGSAVFALANTEGQARQLTGVVARDAWSAVVHTVSLPWKGDA